jgi:hypothetical protein
MEDAVLSLVQKLISTFDTLAPARLVSKPSYLRKIFISPATTELMRKRNLIQKECHRNPFDRNLKNRLKILKKTCKSQINVDSKIEMDSIIN